VPAATPARRALLVVGSALVVGAAGLGPVLPASAVPTTPGVTAAAAGAVAAAPTPSPAPAVTPSSPGGEVLVRDETGTDLVLPILVGTVLALLVLGAVFASAITKRQNEERRL